MARRPDPTRKPALLQQTIAYLADKPLSSLTFRSLARALDVSTFTLVYHFGTRAELVREIVRMNARGVSPHEAAMLPAGTLDDYFASLSQSWRWTQLPENLHRQRLELEAGLLEAVERDELSITRDYFGRWIAMGTAALVALGVERGAAEVEARLLVNTFHGVQFDLVLNQNIDASNAVFETAIAHHRSRVEQLIAEVAR
ncbi:TetR/AcrR family transcriptional regulator [Salinibacterium sp. NSLL150]|nr:TetR/AcrR family transcriptional regulator [Salinibacterium sp. NSLL35]MBH0102380.1 TetR/AcrR family transcriptional regulator [Salinibacterium sp. NSLL150]MBH0105140.1 TetR/AcrR family transcriptional regulator [Salinibacterium sp. NSLL16]MBH0107900.1 TetR/AcrR family transcriptional regulator [Salinibacterium sp. NSLL17]MBH0110666.1 TetR/AcrR family transcriptional regulator [Salinibacterium sp. NG22]